MTELVRLAVRDWDYLTPLLLGDIETDPVQLKVDRVNALIDDFEQDEHYDACEMSFSRYIQARARGEDAYIALPNFLMRGFRHRCVITLKNSRLENFKDLKDRKIGVTGWQDSGNTWTRAAFAEAGIGVEDAYWYAGRLTAAHPIEDRIGRFGREGRIMPMPDEKPMMEALEDGELDAVCTPFMPVGFFQKDSVFRHLLKDFRIAEIAYYRAVGYIPGMHVLAFKKDFLKQKADIAQHVSDLLDQTRQVWLEKRRKYAETTPWIIDDLGFSGRELEPDWDESGFEHNEKMTSDFIAEMRSQNIIEQDLSVRDAFPDITRL